MSNESKYLFRALRREEIEAGNVLIPKGQGPFQADPRLGIDTRLPFKLGPTEEHAVRQHQWNQSGFPTSGVSTTPHISRAKYYAQKNKVIVKIDRIDIKKMIFTKEKQLPDAWCKRPSSARFL
jgi:hypothetical protein